MMVLIMFPPVRFSSNRRVCTNFQCGNAICHLTKGFRGAMLDVQTIRLFFIGERPYKGHLAFVSTRKRDRSEGCQDHRQDEVNGWSQSIMVDEGERKYWTKSKRESWNIKAKRRENHSKMEMTTGARNDRE
jgi:hypothetical protein